MALIFQAFTKRFKEKASYEKIDANDDVKDWLDNMTFDKKGYTIILNLFHQMVSTTNSIISSLIHLFSWSGLIDSKLLMKDVFQVPNLKTGKMEPMISALTDEEEEQFKNMLTRLTTVFQVRKCWTVIALILLGFI